MDYKVVQVLPCNNKFLLLFIQQLKLVVTSEYLSGVQNDEHRDIEKYKYIS